MDFVTGDAEFLPLRSGMLDGVLLSGLIHHFPNPTKLAAEVYRVLKAGGRFVAFDPNRINPFMWFYRDKTSPFYSSKGVTPNERPIIAEQVMNIFSTAGFEVAPPDYISPSYQYIASPRLRGLLAFYNAIESLLFRPEIMKSFRAIVITHGTKT
jgi:SAM-dependent methyltransferase